MKLLSCLPLAMAVWSAPAMASVADLSQEWAGYWNARNLDGAIAMYAPEPVFLPTIGKAWDGTAAIRRNFAGLLKNFDPHITLHSLKTGTSGTLGYDTGRYDEVIDRVKGGAPIVARGHYLFVFQRQKRGGWKILEQSFSEDTPVKF
jgi:ketosteroid isomerase-like protein